MLYIAPILSSFASFGDLASTMSSLASGESFSFFSFSMLIDILFIAGAVFYFLGLKEFRGAVNVADGGDVNKLYQAAILIIIAAVIRFIPLVPDFIAGILEIIATIFMLISFNSLSKSQTLPEEARKGASKLSIAMILAVVAFCIGWIPLIGAVSGILYLLTMIYVIIGWRKIQNAAVENPTN